MAKLTARPAVIDFETEPIEARPLYPPEPVGVSIMRPSDRRPRYYAWGHPTKNNCTRQDGIRALKEVWHSPWDVLCHNAKFDLAVAGERLGLPALPWDRVHDTMFLLFLCDPHSPDLQLKPAAERLLGMPSEERDAVLQWAIDNRLLPRNAKNAGHLICLAPGDLVGRYADGDVVRTLRLYERLLPEVEARGMRQAYDRERRLMPVLMRNEREGIRVDLALMRADSEKYARAQETSDAWLRRALKRHSMNVDSDDELADALVSAGKADEALFLRTPTGKRSVAKDSLMGAVTDRQVLSVLQYRSKLATAFGTFLRPWLAEAEACGGIVHPSWNQVRQYGHGGAAGARTGRLSASRFMNVPKPFLEEEGKFEHPAFAKLPELPAVRLYMLPDEGQVWCKRDYSQQELRVLGHFEDGLLMDSFLENPELDVHQLAADLITDQHGMPVSRRHTKTIGFGLLYGMGLGSLAERMGTDVRGAQGIRSAYLSIFPGLKELQDELERRGRSDLPLRTWGGREYRVEPAKWSDKRNRVMSFEYKLLNYLIQGSSADCTKEALIRYDGARRDGRFLVTVHDEINISVPKRAVKSEMALLRDVMASIEFDVPMLSDGGTGPSWGTLTKFNEPRWRPPTTKEKAA